MMVLGVKVVSRAGEEQTIIKYLRGKIRKEVILIIFKSEEMQKKTM